ncbi:MAG: DUF4301 family protein, partial [bacterium]
MLDPSFFSKADLEQLRAHGLDPIEALRQRELLASPPKALRLDRPCRVGDGIRRLSLVESDRYEARGIDTLKRRRVVKFVPASGAATRLFKDLLAALDASEGIPPKAAAELLPKAGNFAFFGDWTAALGVPDAKAFAMLLARGQWRDVLKALLFESGLGYAGLPKALLPFHRVANRSRTALEEHWREAAALGLGHLYLTISPEHDAGFQN